MYMNMYMYPPPCPKHARVQGTPRFFAPPFGFIREFVPKVRPCPRSDRTFFSPGRTLDKGGVDIGYPKKWIWPLFFFFFAYNS